MNRKSKSAIISGNTITKKCLVPQCKKNETNSPSLVFVSVPKNREMRKVWLERANNSCKELNSVCELHFDPQHDIKNYEHIKKALGKSRKGYTAIVFDTIIPHRNIPGLPSNATKYSFIDQESETTNSEQPDYSEAQTISEGNNDDGFIELNFEEGSNTLVCRLCLERKDESDLLNLQHKIEQKTVKELLVNVANLKVNEKSQLPTQVCTTCVIFLLNVQNRLELFKNNEKLLLDAFRSKNGNAEDDDDIIEIVEQTEEIIEVENYTLKSDLEADVEQAIEGHRIDKDTIAQETTNEKTSSTKKIGCLKSIPSNTVHVDCQCTEHTGVKTRRNKRKQSIPKSRHELVPIELISLSGMQGNSGEEELNPESFIENESLASNDDGDVMIGVDIDEQEPEEIIDSDEDVQAEYMKRQQEQIEMHLKQQPRKRKVSVVDDYDDDDFEPEPESEDSDWEYGKKNKKTIKRKPRKSTKGKN